jgi:hypothetical protein
VTIDGFRLGDWIYCTYTLNSQLQVITALPLISTLYTSSQHPLSLFQPTVSSTSRSLATASNSGNSSASRAQVLPSPTLVQSCLPAISSTELDRHFFSVSLAELSCTQQSPAKPQLSSLLLQPLCKDLTENISNNAYIVASVFLTSGTRLPSRCLTMNISSGSTIPAFRRHVTTL